MRIYLAGPPEDGDEYVQAQAKLQRLGHDVICNTQEPLDLRMAIADLTTCDAICLLELWWSDLHATQLSNIASWLHLKFVDTAGEKIPTGSLRGTAG